MTAPSCHPRADARKLLVLDTSYTWPIIAERQLQRLLFARDLHGFFEHVWSVNPLETIFLPRDDPEAYGPPSSFRMSERHTYVGGRLARYAWPRLLALPNFILAQAALVRILTRLIRDEKIDIVRAEDGWYAGFVGVLLSWFTGRPLVVGVWGNPGELRRTTGRPVMARLFRWKWVEATFEKFVLRRADRVIIQNEDNRRHVISTGVPPHRTRFFRLGNILNPIHFEPPDERQGGQQELAALGLAGAEVLLVISRLEPAKLVDHAVRAFAVVRANRPAARLLLVGGGTQENELRQLAERLGVADSVIFAGNRDQSWLHRVTPCVSAVISPLTGRALVEAALARVPLIAYDLDWHGELIESGITGELVPARDYEGLGRAALRVLEDQGYARKIADACYARARAMFDPCTNDREQAAEYLDLLSEWSSSRRAAA